jgi:D-sedoheptulose 7-phosphate isomerase
MPTEREKMLSKDEMTFLSVNAANRLGYGASKVSSLAPAIAEIAMKVATSLRNGGKVFVFGNGGSAAGAQHFAAEFTGKLRELRAPLPAISLNSDSAALTAIGNDFGFEEIFARQVTALVNAKDIVFGLSTSGTSKNVSLGIAAAKEIGAETVGLVGQRDEIGAGASLSVPLSETARIQECHDLILHQIAQVSERLLFGIDDDSSADRFPFLLEPKNFQEFGSWIRRTNQRLVTTNGVFDLLHPGHHHSLEFSRSKGDCLVVCLNSDESVRALKGPSRPLTPMADRLSLLEKIPSVDHVVIFRETTPTSVIEALKPSVHCKGEEYSGRSLPEEAAVLSGGGQIIFVPRLKDYSTSKLLEGHAL